MRRVSSLPLPVPEFFETMGIILFEDAKVADLAPATLTRPAAMIPCGGYQLAELVESLNDVFSAELLQARRLTLVDFKNRNLLVKLRDGIARLFSPYL